MNLQKPIYILSGIATVLVLLLVVAIVIKSERSAGTVTTLADVSRRLELAGYSYVKEQSIAGTHWVTYERKNPGATFTAHIERWYGDDRLKMLAFYCDTDFATFDSADARETLWNQLDIDVCAMMNGASDYFRALTTMTEAEGEGIPRFEGRATTAEGWQITVVEYVRRIKLGETVPMAQVWLSHIETEEDMPASAVLEYERQMEEAKRKADNLQ